MNTKFNPIVLVFSCNWCSYTSADLAGINRYRYPPNVKIIRFMCSGRIEPDFIMHAFELGADGILVTGCKLGDCHYVSGNEKAKERVEMTKELLDILGIGAARLNAEWLTASEGERFAATVANFVAEIANLGPNPLKRTGV